MLFVILAVFILFVMIHILLFYDQCFYHVTKLWPQFETYIGKKNDYKVNKYQLIIATVSIYASVFFSTNVKNEQKKTNQNSNDITTKTLHYRYHFNKYDVNFFLHLYACIFPALFFYIIWSYLQHHHKLHVKTKKT